MGIGRRSGEVVDGVSRQVDDAHPALAKLEADLVRAEQIARGQGHGRGNHSAGMGVSVLAPHTTAWRDRPTFWPTRSRPRTYPSEAQVTAPNKRKKNYSRKSCRVSCVEENGFLPKMDSAHERFEFSRQEMISSKRDFPQNNHFAFSCQDNDFSRKGPGVRQRPPVRRRPSRSQRWLMRGQACGSCSTRCLRRNRPSQHQR